MLTVVAKALVIWFGILALAIVNGLIRESLFVPGFGTPVALVLSGLLLSVLIIVVAYFSLPWLQVHHPVELFMVGAGWLVLTLVFEFSFGFWQGKSWSELLEAYTFKGGNIWSVVLVTTAFAPYIAAKMNER